jgi:hypothetical protein
MRTKVFTIMCCAAVVGLTALSAPVTAQHKTAKACRDEWRANKTAMLASGKTEKAYVAECSFGVSDERAPRGSLGAIGGR